MLIICDKCKKALTDKEINVLEENIDSGKARKLYYVTPCCNNKNIIGFTNIKCDKIKKQIDKYRKLNNGKEVSKLSKTLKKEMDYLKEYYANI